MSEPPLRAPWLKTIARAFADGTVYAVGGAVRNTLMGLPVSDVDLCGAARPDEVQALCEGTAITARLRAAHFGTVELHLDGHMAEYTTFRRDSYRGGHQPFAVRFADTIEEDALRRDFSVNALYAPLSRPDEVIDPTGGRKHIAARILHTVTSDPDQVLKDDGLRILRAVRFQAELDFSPTEALLQSAAKYCGLLDEIVPERKRDELTRLLTSDTKYPTLTRGRPPVSAGLATLLRIGAWPKLFGALEPVDVSVMDHTAALPVSGKFAVLYHRAEPAQLYERMEALRYAKRDAAYAADALSALRAIQAQRNTAEALRFGQPAVTLARDVLKALAAADAQYRPALLRADALVASVTSGRLPASLRELAVGGRELLRLCRETGAPRERIGAVLDSLWRDAADGRIPNKKAPLLLAARKHLIDRQNDG